MWGLAISLKTSDFLLYKVSNRVHIVMHALPSGKESCIIYVRPIDGNCYCAIGIEFGEELPSEDNAGSNKGAKWIQLRTESLP